MEQEKQTTQEEKEKILQENQNLEIQAISQDFNISEKDIKMISSQILKKGTFDELRYFLNFAKSVELNPFTKEIWAYKDYTNNLIIFVSRDGFRKIAQRNPNFLSINSVDVYSNDKFKMYTDEDMNLKISHSVENLSDRGNLLGAYAIVKTKTGTITEFADLKTFDKNQNTWKSHKSEMIKKVAETHAIKKMCNISGIYAEEEFESIKYANYEEVDNKLQKELNKIINPDDLQKFYEDNKNNQKDKKLFNKLIIQKKDELKNTQNGTEIGGVAPSKEG